MARTNPFRTEDLFKTQNAHKCDQPGILSFFLNKQT